MATPEDIDRIRRQIALLSDPETWKRLQTQIAPLSDPETWKRLQKQIVIAAEAGNVGLAAIMLAEPFMKLAEALSEKFGSPRRLGQSRRLG